MELGKAEAVRVFNYHQRRVRHVHADLHDRGRDKNVRLSARERAERRIFVRLLHFAVQKAYTPVGEDDLPERLREALGGFETVQVGFLDCGADDIDLMARLALFFNKGVQPLTLVFSDQEGIDRETTGRKLSDDGNVQISVGDERERPRDRRGRHDEKVRRLALGRKRGSLRHTEAVLLIADDEGEILECHVLRDERVRADDELRAAVCNFRLVLPLLRGSQRARHQNYGDPKRRKELFERLRVLLGEDFGRGHEGRLMAVLDRAEARRRRDHRLAASDVSLHEPVHGTAGREVAQNVIDGRLLRAGERKGEKAVKRLHMVRVHGFGMQLVPLGADGGEACGKDEKFLKDEPPARFLQSLKRRGKVHCLIGKVRGAKTIAGLYGRRQNVRKRIQARV